VTPQQHIDEAERLLNDATSDRINGKLDRSNATLLMAAVHALIALAVENGVPHAVAPAVGGTGVD
jgi:hypothetical protein